jgi:hypothetical protein
MSRVLLLADGLVVFALGNELMFFRDTGLGPLDTVPGRAATGASKAIRAMSVPCVILGLVIVEFEAEYGCGTPAARTAGPSSACPKRRPRTSAS